MVVSSTFEKTTDDLPPLQKGVFPACSQINFIQRLCNQYRPEVFESPQKRNTFCAISLGDRPMAIPKEKKNLLWLFSSVYVIGVRGVFLQRGGISQPSILLACFNSAGGVNAGLWNSLKGDVSLSCFGEGGNFVLTNLGPTILDRCTHEGMTFLWKTILSSKTLGIGKE